MQSHHPITTVAKTFGHTLTLPRIAASLVIVALTVFATPSFANEPESEKLICCGAAQVFIVDASDPTKQLWSWNASDSPSIPEDFRVKFRSTCS
tara:strand:+ start:58 stop:339 length:282 start_codon:yes stop_codon:yes gene_type:complete